MAEKSAIRILIVDDDFFSLKLLIRMLANSGFTHVATCDDGHAALERIDNSGRHPDLILLDLNMPGMDGGEFVRHLVERSYKGGLILVSGEDERVLQVAENLVHAHRLTLLGSLRKPVAPDRLVALIGKWPPPSQGNPLRAATKVYGATELRAAIKKGELVNYYQPKVVIATGRVMGAEALVRWQHPSDGLLLPGDFVGAAEEYGLIDDLARVVLSSAFAQARLWQETGLALQLAVNVSINNLVSLEFADFISDLAATAGVAPQQVVLEVAESRIMSCDLRALLEPLTRLRLKRFRLSIDDFGYGHILPEQLRNIPFDEVKIDRSFVHHVSSDGAKQAKFDASLSLARQLNMEAVAEGVEDRDDWDFLCRSGCDLAQGYLIAEPMPATDLAGWIQAGHARR